VLEGGANVEIGAAFLAGDEENKVDRLASFQPSLGLVGHNG